MDPSYVLVQADVLGAPEGAGSAGGALGGLFGKATATRATTVGTWLLQTYFKASTGSLHECFCVDTCIAAE